MNVPTIEGYRTRRVLYATANTTVLEAEARGGLAVVLKLSTSDQPSLTELARYRREWELLQLLDSPRIVRGLRMEQVGQRYVLVSEDTHSSSLAERFANERPSLSTFLQIALDAARALRDVHAAGIIHKDINPANLVTDDAGATRIIDFGISTRLARESHAAEHPRMLEGTLAYMSPEQTGRMNCPVDARSDLYSLGVTFYWLLTGAPPFTCDDPLEYVHAHIALEPRSLAELAPATPAILVMIIARLMAKSVDQRYATAHGLVYDLERIAEQVRTTGGATPFELQSQDIAGKLEIPSTLYGREKELGLLVTTLERVTRGKAELVAVGGYSGIGKSALVHELHKEIVTRRGYYAAGKFDQYNRNVPYSAVAAAFQSLVQYLLMEPPSQVAEWRRSLLRALAGNGRVLIEVIPALELLIGAQPPVAPLSSVEAKSRFDETFRALIRQLAKPTHPLVLFLDDVQWADTSSLHLLNGLLTDPDARSLLVITAYRDNEVTPAHPAMLVLSELEKSTPVHRVTLGPLTARDTRHLVSDVLRVSGEEAQPLADLLFGRTGGNPFFLLQLIQSLAADGLLRWELGSRQWAWDVDAIRALGITDDVIELMSSRLRRLPETTRARLRVAACIGNMFELSVVAEARSESLDETEKLLWPALSEGLIVPARAGLKDHSKRGTYRFLHDRVQQAAYALIPESERDAEHLAVGWLLLRTTPPEQLEGKLFDVVAHLDRGLAHVTDPAQLRLIADLNARAARRAKAASAHRAAAANYAIAMRLFGPAIWTEDYALAYEIHRDRAECEYVAGNFEVADELAMETLGRCTSTLDSARVYSVRILSCITSADFAKATQVGLEALRLFGYDIPSDPDSAEEARLRQTALLERELEGLDIDALLHRPTQEDAEQRVLGELLVDVWCAAYFTGNLAVQIFTVELLVRLAIQGGNTPESAFGYVVYGTRLTAAGQARRGYNFGSLGVRLNEKLPAPLVTVRAGQMFANTINPFFNHLESNLAFYRRTYEIGPRVGEIIYTVWAVNFMLLLKLMKGDLLSEVYDESIGYLDFVRETNDLPILTSYRLALQMVRTLQGRTPKRDDLDEDDFSEREAVQRHIDTKFWPGFLFYGAFRTGVHVVFRDFDAALKAAEFSEQALPSDSGFWTSTNHFFYQALALAGAYDPSSGPPAEATISKIEANLAKLTGWAETCEANFAHRRDLVHAELARIQGRTSVAAGLFDRALDGAKAGRFHNDVALAAELAGRFHLELGSARAARVHFAEAHYGYQRWGATAKARELETEFPGISAALRAHVGAAPTTHGTVSATTSTALVSLDSRTAMKAAQVLSGEIDRDELTTKLLQLAMENAGARSATLILSEGSALNVVAAASVDAACETGRSVPLDQWSSLPTPLVQFVARTMAPLVLHNAERDGRFRVAPRPGGRAAMSIACIPLLRQGRLTGALYLENDLVEGAFTADRLETLQIIAAQAAISLENAALYASLEARVQARTAELNDQNQRMRIVLDNVEQGFLLADASGILDDQRSRIVDEWFGPLRPATHLWDYLYESGSNRAVLTEMAWEQMIDQVLPLELAVDQMPNRIVRGGRSLEVSYRPVRGDDSEIKRVIVVVSDITQRLIAAEAERKRQELADALDHALSDRLGFKEFTADGHRLVAQILDPSLDRVRVLRAIHTLKGNCGVAKMSSVAAVCHEVETVAFETEADITTQQRAAIRQAWLEIASKLADLVLRQHDATEIRSQDLTMLVHAIRDRAPHHDLEAILSMWNMEPIVERFHRLGESAQALAERLGKGHVRVEVECDDLRASPERLAPLWSSFVHIIRNAIDHGVDSAAQRLAKAKPEHATLTFRARSTPECVEIELSDDGRGIDWESLRQKARARGLRAETTAELADALFADGVSTRDDASEISGRGVGMAAVKSAVLELGGTVEVRSERDRGTTTTLRLPAALFTSAPRVSRSPRESAFPPPSC